MNAKIAVPENIPEKLHELYREFVIAQMIQGLLVEHGATRAQAIKMTMFVAMRSAFQLTHPHAVAQAAQNAVDMFSIEVEKHIQKLFADPAVQLRLEAQGRAANRFAVMADAKTPLEVNILEEHFRFSEDGEAAPKVIVPS